MNDTEVLNDEFTKIFDAYRARIDEITRHTQRNFTPDNAANKPAPTNTPEKTETFVSPAPAPPEPAHSTVRLELPVVKESEVIIKEAKRQARQIIAEAENNIRKEARKKTQIQVDRILGKAQEEAESIINRAAQAVEIERAEAVSLLKQESEKAIQEITEKCRRESHEQSAQIIAETQKKSARMMTDIISSSAEIGRQLNEIINRAKNTISEFEIKMQWETSELAKAISESQNKLLQITMLRTEEEPQLELSGKHKESTNNPTLSVHLQSDKSNGQYSRGGLFCGQLEMKSDSGSFNYQYIKNLKKYLGQIPSIKYLQESASEREISVLFDVKEPLPLLDILNHIPLIEEVLTETDEDICLVFKNTE